MEMQEESFQAKKNQELCAFELQSKCGLAQMHDIAVCKAPGVVFPQPVYFSLQFHAVCVEGTYWALRVQKTHLILVEVLVLCSLGFFPESIISWVISVSLNASNFFFSLYFPSSNGN